MGNSGKHGLDRVKTLFSRRFLTFLSFGEGPRKPWKTVPAGVATPGVVGQNNSEKILPFKGGRIFRTPSQMRTASMVEGFAMPTAIHQLYSCSSYDCQNLKDASQIELALTLAIAE